MLAPMDEVVKAFVHGLCERPFVGSDEKGEDVDVRHLIAKVLTESNNAGEGKHVYLEQKTKFWEAKLEGDSVLVRYGKKKTKGQANSHVGPDAQEYFDKKVREKLRGGYKAVDANAALRKKVLAAIEKDAGESDPKVRCVVPVQNTIDSFCRADRRKREASSTERTSTRRRSC